MRERRIQLVVSAVSVAPALLAVLQQILEARIGGEAPRWRQLAFTGGDWLMLTLLTPLVCTAALRLPFDWKRSLAPHIAGALLFAVAWASLGMLLAMPLHTFPAIPPLVRSYVGWIVITIPFASLIYLAVVAGVYAYRYSTQLAEARLGALRMQLNPHFLFNTLNTVLVLVREKETTAAARMLELLGDSLRNLLRADRPQLVPLADELRFLEQYLAIEEVRYSDRLRVEWSIDDRARQALVPDLILQPLVENAIRHGVSKRAEGGTIAITARVAGDQLEVSIRDDGVAPAIPPAEGVGLSNTKERLRGLYGAAAGVTIQTLEPRGTEVTLRIPFRT